MSYSTIIRSLVTLATILAAAMDTPVSYTHLQALTKVVLPSSLPAIISNMKVNIGLCLVGVIIGEFLAAKNGLGYLIIYSSQVFTCEGNMIL